MNGDGYGHLYQRVGFVSAIEHWGWQAMRERLGDLGYARDAAAEMAALTLMAASMRIRIGRLAGVFQAVELMDAGVDGDAGVVGEVEVRAALAVLRADGSGKR